VDRPLSLPLIPFPFKWMGTLSQWCALTAIHRIAWLGLWTSQFRATRWSSQAWGCSIRVASEVDVCQVGSSVLNSKTVSIPPNTTVPKTFGSGDQSWADDFNLQNSGNNDGPETFELVADGTQLLVKRTDCPAGSVDCGWSRDLKVPCRREFPKQGENFLKVLLQLLSAFTADFCNECNISGEMKKHASHTIYQRHFFRSHLKMIRLKIWKCSGMIVHFKKNNNTKLFKTKNVLFIMLLQK
jgi:hypothetical protein